MSLAPAALRHRGKTPRHTTKPTTAALLLWQPGMALGGNSFVAKERACHGDRNQNSKDQEHITQSRPPVTHAGPGEARFVFHYGTLLNTSPSENQPNGADYDRN